jgi:hypothetical protein
LKIATPDRSDVPIFEPGLHPLMVRNIAAGRLPSTNLLRYRAFERILLYYKKAAPHLLPRNQPAHPQP